MSSTRPMRFDGKPSVKGRPRSSPPPGSQPHPRRRVAFPQGKIEGERPQQGAGARPTFLWWRPRKPVSQPREDSMGGISPQGREGFSPSKIQDFPSMELGVSVAIIEVSTDSSGQIESPLTP